MCVVLNLAQAKGTNKRGQNATASMPSLQTPDALAYSSGQGLHPSALRNCSSFVLRTITGESWLVGTDASITCLPFSGDSHNACPDVILQEWLRDDRLCYVLLP